MADFAKQREQMVREQLMPRGVRDAGVLGAMGAVPREVFVPAGLRGRAYADGPLSIGHGQTISQPAVVAEMIQAARVGPSSRVLEVGAGSGYAAAVLGKIAERVVAIERVGELARQAALRMIELGYDNVEVVAGDGSVGLAEASPFDAIIVSAGGPAVPEALLSQLAVGGRLVMPVGESEHEQELVVVERVSEDDYRWQRMGPVRFVPLVGVAGWDEGASD